MYTRSHMFEHLHSTTTCFDSYNSLSFKIIDKANSKFDLKIKEALHINWKKPNLNAQQNHLALTLSLQLVSPLCSFYLCFLLPFPFIYYKLPASFTVLKLHFAITQSHYNTSCKNIFNNYAINICPRKLLKLANITNFLLIS